MIQIEIPGREIMRIENLLLDYNGTLATDGMLIPGTEDLLRQLSKILKIYVITADTFGTVEAALLGLPLSVIRLDSPDERNEKLEKAYDLGPNATIAIGNGKNDALMLREAVIGICIIGSEGCASETLAASDIVVHDILDALQLLLNPTRIKATLRY